MMFALAFLHPLILWGLALGSIPIIIHLFHRRKFHVVLWGAMAFLLSSSKLKARRLKILQLLLLLTRIMVILLLVTALARPHLTGQLFAGFLSGEKTASVILIDNSFSMNAKSGETAFERSKRAIEEIVSNFRRSDSVTVIAFSNEPKVIAQNVSDPDSLKTIILSIPMSDCSTNVQAAIEKALAILQEEKVSKKEIFLVTDGRKNGWSVEDVAQWNRLDSFLSKMKTPPKLHIIDVGSPESDNSCFSAINIEAADSSTAGRYVLDIEIQAYGSEISQSPAVKFFADDMKQEQARIKGGDYENGVSKAQQPFKLEEDRFHQGKVELLDADALPNDNTHYYSIQHRKGLPILCVEGMRKGGASKTTADLVRIALAPEKSAKGSVIIPAEYSNIMAPEQISLPDMYEKHLQDYETVILSNARSLEQRDYESLKYFVRRGGGLAIFLGEGIEPEKYNALFDADEKTIIPAKIESLVGKPALKERKPNEKEYMLSEFDFNHPVLRNFKGGQDGDLTLFRFYAYFKVIADESNPDIKVLARFNNGDPFIIERKAGRGKVILITAEPTTDWSNLGPRPAFLPLMHHLARYLAGDAGKRFNLIAGEAISYPLDSLDNSATVIDPNGISYKIQPEIIGDADLKFAFLNFKETATAGIYELNLPSEAGTAENEDKKTNAIYFAVNTDPLESDLTVLDEKVIKGMLKNINANYIKYGQDFAIRIKESRQGKEIWRYLMVTVLALLVTETTLAYIIDKS